MSRNPRNPSPPKAPPEELTTDESIVDSAPDSALEATPLRKPAGKPVVRTRVAKPKIGATAKIHKPTFGVVRGVYN
jgi:hypothetical protein